MKHKRAYLDNAATSWPKPDAVYAASDQFARELGSSASRGTHRQALEATQIVERTRAKLRQLFGAAEDDAVVFCFNGTDALNLCIHGIVQENDHVITTVTDHNSVLRPLRELESQKSVEVDLADCDQRGFVSKQQIERFLVPTTRLVAISHGSNVTGTIQPIDEIGAAVRDAGGTFLVDAAQTAGEIPIDMQAMNIDILATSGHKGLLGPLGTGVAVIRRSLIERVASFRQGGTGTQSENDRQPNQGEDKYESGSLNLPGIAGLEAGVDHILEHGPKLAAQKQKLTERLIRGLKGTQQATIYGIDSADYLPEKRLPVVSFNLESIDCHELAMLLESEAGIQIRAGLHCAPCMHQALGTTARGGTARASFGVMNSNQHVDHLLSALQAITQST